jgi:hypothetical protein
MCKFAFGQIASAAAFVAAAFAAGPVGDIVWPEYTLVSKPYDAKLTCTQLKAEIDRVDADLWTLRQAHSKAADAARVTAQMRSPTGMPLSDTSNIRTSNGGGLYAETLSRVNESRDIAKARREHLEGLLPACKNEPAAPSP